MASAAAPSKAGSPPAPAAVSADEGTLTTAAVDPVNPERPAAIARVSGTHSRSSSGESKGSAQQQSTASRDSAPTNWADEEEGTAAADRVVRSVSDAAALVGDLAGSRDTAASLPNLHKAAGEGGPPLSGASLAEGSGPVASTKKQAARDRTMSMDSLQSTESLPVALQASAAAKGAAGSNRSSTSVALHCLLCRSEAHETMGCDQVSGLSVAKGANVR
jgi:hypothetical protein